MDKFEINLSRKKVVDALGEIQARFIEQQLPSRNTPYILCSDLQSRYSLRKVDFFARNEDGTDQGNLAAFFSEPPPPEYFEFLADFGQGIYQLAWIVQLIDKGQSTVIHVALSDNPTAITQTNYDVFVHFLKEWANDILSAQAVAKQKEYAEKERREKEKQQKKKDDVIKAWENSHFKLLSTLELKPQTRRRMRYCIRYRKNLFFDDTNGDCRFLPPDEWVRQVLSGERNAQIEKFLSADKAEDLITAINKAYN